MVLTSREVNRECFCVRAVNAGVVEQNISCIISRARPFLGDNRTPTVDGDGQFNIIQKRIRAWTRLRT